MRRMARMRTRQLPWLCFILSLEGLDEPEDARDDDADEGE